MGMDSDAAAETQPLANTRANKGSAVRRLGRVIAMQALYEIDAVGTEPDASVEALGAEHGAPSQAVRFASQLVHGTLERLPEIDTAIQERAPQFPLAQIAGVDRAVLRLAVYELRHGRGVPPKVAINEAVDIAKEYGNESSGRFVNGVLGHVAPASSTP